LPESDHYSLGAIMIYMLTGVNLEHVEKRYVPNKLDDRIKTFVRALLQSDILDRPREAHKLFKELDDIRRDVFNLSNDITHGIRRAD